MSNNTVEVQLKVDLSPLQLECRPQDLQNFFNGPVWRDIERVLDEAIELGLNQLTDLDIIDQMEVERTRARLYQTKWLRNELEGYMIGVAEGLTPE